MKKKEKQQIMQKKPSELDKLITQKREEIARATLKRSEQKNTNLIKKLRNELAIMSTALHEQRMVQELSTEVSKHE
jgi:hypothetical protein